MTQWTVTALVLIAKADKSAFAEKKGVISMNAPDRGLRLLLLSFPCTLLLGATPPSGNDHTYVGAKACKMCHIKEHRSWADTKMAKTFEVLKAGASADKKRSAGLDPAKDYTKDAECLSCHATGYGEPGGFVNVESTPELAGVTCEACHGAGGTYVQDEYMSLKNKEYKKAEVVAVGLVDSIDTEVCAKCHNVRSPFVGDDYVFDFEARRDQGIHEIHPLKYQH
jgi:Zn finger protein HypA/HybF involved in hydrogenase expression